MLVEVRDKISNELLTSEPITAGTVLNDWLAANIDDFRPMHNPEISISINGKIKLQAHWDHVVAVNDMVVIYPEPKATAIVGLIIKAVVSAAISYAISALTTPKLTNNYASSVPQGSSIYSANAQGNRPRLNGIIPEIFGTHKYYPDVITAPWREYVNDEQWLHLLVCVGVGEYDISDISIGNTPIDRYVGDIEASLYEPGQYIPTANAAHMYTSLEVGSTSGGSAGINLESDGTSPWYGPFFACPADVTTDAFYIDLVYSGLATIGNDGSVSARTTSIEVQWKDKNATVWQSRTIGKTAGTTDQLGITHYIQATVSGEIAPEVRIRRLTTNSSSTQVYDDMSWTGLKSRVGRLTDTKNTYPDLTTLYLKIKGTNAIAGSAENRVNLIASRKLPNYQFNNFTAPAATQEVAPVVAYIAKDAGIADDNIDLGELFSLNYLWNSQNITFNAVFDGESTLFPSLKRVLSVAYAFPVIKDGQISVVRDLGNSLHDQMFTPDNTFSITENGTLFDPDEPDGVTVEYFSEETWKPEIIECRTGNDGGIKSEEVRAFGITNATAAWRYGMRVRLAQHLIRRTWEIETELEGHNCDIGSKAVISGRGGQHGWLTAFSQQGEQLWFDTNVPLNFEAGIDHYILLRRQDGVARYQMICTEYSDPNGVYKYFVDNYTISLLDPIVDDSKDSTLFQFGKADELLHEAIVKTIEPQGDRVRLELAEYNPDVYANDNLSPP